jgi:hypothetical protein
MAQIHKKFTDDQIKNLLQRVVPIYLYTRKLDPISFITSAYFFKG